MGPVLGWTLTRPPPFVVCDEHEEGKKYRNFAYTRYGGPWEGEGKIVYSCEGREICPTTGREHWQGVVRFKSPRTLSGVIKRNPGMHWGTCIASLAKNITYCQKDGEYTTRGEVPKQGKRTDLITLGRMITSGMTDEGIIQYDDPERDWAGTWVRNYRGIREARKIVLPPTPRNWQMEVILIWGNPGCGKTRWVHENEPDLYVKSPGKWWDGFTGQNSVLFDDFDPADSFDIKFPDWLKLCDRYKMQVQNKGGFTEFNPHKIYITSNFDPEEWFLQVRNRSAFTRRVTEIRHMDGGEPMEDIEGGNYWTDFPSGVGIR